MRHHSLIASFLLMPALAVSQNAPVPTLHTDVRLTTVDVVITDKNGNPVSGLKKEDFSVRENKQTQALRGFEEHTGTTPTQYDPPRPGVFTNATAARGGVSNVLLIDFLNTTPQDQPFMRDQLVKFVQGQPAGTRTAIFAMNSSVTLLQDFTADPRILKTALVNMGTRFSAFVTRPPAGPNENVQALEQLGQGLFRPQRDQVARYGVAGSGGFGAITGGSLEGSNVELSQQFTDMIVIQRGYQASSQVLTVANEMLQQLLEAGKK